MKQVLFFILSVGILQAAENYSCVKKYYSQIKSCKEAMYLYKVCGFKELDGDKDGTPCELLCGKDYRNHKK